jgi:hypothetical protein
MKISRDFIDLIFFFENFWNMCSIIFRVLLKSSKVLLKYLNSGALCHYWKNEGFSRFYVSPIVFFTKKLGGRLSHFDCLHCRLYNNCEKIWEKKSSFLSVFWQPSNIFWKFVKHVLTYFVLSLSKSFYIWKYSICKQFRNFIWVSRFSRFSGNLADQSGPFSTTAFSL